MVVIVPVGDIIGAAHGALLARTEEGASEGVGGCGGGVGQGGQGGHHPRHHHQHPHGPDHHCGGQDGWRVG